MCEVCVTEKRGIFRELAEPKVFRMEGLCSASKLTPIIELSNLPVAL